MVFYSIALGHYVELYALIPKYARCIVHDRCIAKAVTEYGHTLTIYNNIFD